MTERHERPLPFEVRLPSKRTEESQEHGADEATLLLLLHGRGSDERDLLGLAPLLPQEWVLVTPRAPHPGAPWGYGPGWAWYRYLEADRVAEDSLGRSLDALDELLAQLPDHLGLQPSRIVMGGFSQGGTTSLAYALTRPTALAAALNFSGFLADSVDLTNAAAAPPIYWGHGRHDPNIPFELAVRGRERLAAAGARVVAADHDIGHWIVPEEVSQAVEVIGSV